MYIRSIILFLTTFFFCDAAYAQTISRNVVSSAGGTLTSGGSIINYNIGETVIPTLSAGANLITQGFEQPGEQIKTGTLPLIICAGAEIAVPYNAIDIGGGNTFTAQLSDATGSFAAPVAIGTISGNASGNITATIPALTAQGTGYRIRVVSNSPETKGTDNGTDMTISQGLAPAVTGNVNVCSVVGTATAVTYTASSVGATSYIWAVPPNVVIQSGQGTANLTVTFLAGFTAQANKQVRVRAVGPCGTSVNTVYYLSAQFPGTPRPIIASATDVCPILGTNVPITFTIPKVPGASSYNWVAQAGTTTITHPNGLGENDTTVAVTFSGSFSTSAITVQSVNACGVSGIRSFTITRSNPGTPGLISGPINVCRFISPTMSTATYSVALMPGVTAYNWTLPPGALAINGQGTNTVSFKYPTGYTGGSIGVTATNGCGTSVVARTLSVTTLNPATPSPIDVQQISTCPSRVYTYTLASLPANASNILWTIPVGYSNVSGLGTTSITVSYSSAAVAGQLTAQAVSNCGLSVIRFLDVKLPECPPEFTKNNQPLSKGIAADRVADAMDISVFPNPTVRDFKLQVQTISKEIIHVRVLDMLGREYKLLQMMPGETLSLGETLKAGSYILEVRQGKNMKSKKLLKF